MSNPWGDSEAEGRVHNFTAGPSALPFSVVQRVQQELANYGSTGMGIMEMSHRSKAFVNIVKDAEKELRTLLSIPDSYCVTFVPGGATTQFAAVPLNLHGNATAATTDAGTGAAASRPSAHYIVTGTWSEKAAEEAAKYLDVVVTASTKTAGSAPYTTLPAAAAGGSDRARLAALPTPAYTYLCTNETVHGVELPLPQAAGGDNDNSTEEWWESLVHPGSILVADMSSHFCSRPFDVSRFGVIIAGAQKNIGPAGITVVIARRDLLSRARADTPVMLRWDTAADNDSLYNTPPAFPLYVTGLVLQWLRTHVGGIAGVECANAAKATALYAAIDGSDGFYTAPVAVDARSRMNVIFRIAGGSKTLEAAFVAAAEARGLSGLAGHRSVGGLRASLYNAVSPTAVDALVAFMAEFREEHTAPAHNTLDGMGSAPQTH